MPHEDPSMIATTEGSTRNPASKLGQDRSEAPEFRVTFSRPVDFAGRSEPHPNSFRWAGAGILHVLERGLLIIAKRRFPLGFRTTEERFVAASEISDVCREGNSVRVDLRGNARGGTFFQFWTPDAATAGTIVRLLPTTRTIEYESSPLSPAPVPAAHSSSHRSMSARALVPIAAVAAGLIAIALWVIALRSRPHTEAGPPAISVSVPAPRETTVTPRPQRAPPSEIAAALADLERFDDRLDGLRAQYRMASAALQTGDLSQERFVVGVDQWLVPQWRALYGELIANPPPDGSLASRVRNRLMTAARAWDAGLRQYIAALKDKDYAAVLQAFDRMSAAEAAQREARQIIDEAGR
jgi:hypothetical protein